MELLNYYQRLVKADYMPLDSLFQILELLENRLDVVITIIKENEDID